MNYNTSGWSVGGGAIGYVPVYKPWGSGFEFAAASTFFINHTHRNAQEVRVFTLLILLSPLCTFYDSFLIYFAANIYISVKCTGSSKKYAVHFFSVRYILFKANMHIICTFFSSCVLRWNEHVLNNYCQHTVKKILVIFKVNINNKKKILELQIQNHAQ